MQKEVAGGGPTNGVRRRAGAHHHDTINLHLCPFTQVMPEPTCSKWLSLQECVLVPLKQQGIAARYNVGEPICFHYLLSQHKDHKLFALTISSEATQGPSPPSKANLPTVIQNLPYCVELL